MILTNKFANKIGIKNMNNVKNMRVTAEKCNFPFIYGIINESKPSVSPSIIIIVLKMDINGS